eukprot:TRINITY_DN16628_c0_g1_i1.p1 TRINITY_DN16628_c0_g1~~TRINITY_DN16628_c0_g1_i1.p1  ORF type:complete len:312 (+),score=95.53 TRINITY_DN16628_c0_g1_i1:39-974(+)
MARPYSIVVHLDAPLQEGSVDVSAGVQFNRVALPAADHLIDEEWNARLRKIEESMKKLALFNKTKFRLHAAEVVGEGAAKRCAMKLGITDYQSCIGTNNRIGDVKAALPQPHSDGALDAVLSQALGVEALVMTNDDHVVLFKRSVHVAELPGWYCCPGGHAEPSAVLTKHEHMLHGSAQENAAVHDVLAGELSQLAGDAAKELFASITEEVVAEVGVQAGDVRNLGLKAIIKSDLTRKPDAIFMVLVDKSAEEVDTLFRTQKAAEEYEVDGPLLFLPVRDVKASLANPTPTGVLAKYNITPPSMACLELCL